MKINQLKKQCIETAIDRCLEFDLQNAQDAFISATEKLSISEDLDVYWLISQTAKRLSYGLLGKNILHRKGLSDSFVGWSTVFKLSYLSTFYLNQIIKSLDGYKDLLKHNEINFENIGIFEQNDVHEVGDLVLKSQVDAYLFCLSRHFDLPKIHEKYSELINYYQSLHIKYPLYNEFQLYAYEVQKSGGKLNYSSSELNNMVGNYLAQEKPCENEANSILDTHYTRCHEGLVTRELARTSIYSQPFYVLLPIEFFDLQKLKPSEVLKLELGELGVEKLLTEHISDDNESLQQTLARTWESISA